MSDQFSDQQSAEDLPEHLDDVEGTEAQAEAAEVPKTGPMRFARMTGSSIAGRDAAPWVTDFLNAAYYRRPGDARDVEDLRLAFAIITTYWYRKASGRRLHVTDLPAFHRAFGGERFDTSDSGRGLLSREQLLAGAVQLLGDWYPAPTPTASAAAGESRSRPSRSAPPTIPPSGWRSPAWVS